MPSDEWDAKARSVGTGRLGPTYAEIAAFAREAYQRGRNEADTAAERRGIERAAERVGALAVLERMTADGFGREGDIDTKLVHVEKAISLEEAERKLRALAQPAATSERSERVGD